VPHLDVLGLQQDHPGFDRRLLQFDFGPRQQVLADGVNLVVLYCLAGHLAVRQLQPQQPRPPFGADLVGRPADVLDGGYLQHERPRKARVCGAVDVLGQTTGAYLQ
jgi:hypothetical protein